jgi:hypothetical protein
VTERFFAEEDLKDGKKRAFNRTNPFYIPDSNHFKPFPSPQSCRGTTTTSYKYIENDQAKTCIM